jgi:hypothetical protein
MMRRKRLTNAETAQENRFIWAFVIIIVIMLGIALYGYLSGYWETAQ